MSDPAVDRWKQQGRICMWRHKHRHTHWNIAADKTGCDSLIGLLELMAHVAWPSRRLVQLVRPRLTATGVPLDAPAEFADDLLLRYPKDQVPADYWQMETVESTVRLILGQSRLRELLDAIRDIARGGGDYSIGDKLTPLWMWWYVDEAVPTA